MKTKAEVLNLLNQLDQQGVNYLAFDAYNDVDHTDRYRDLYLDLYDSVIADRLFYRFNIDPQDNDVLVTAFAKDDYFNGNWFVNFFDPDLEIGVTTILNDDPKLNDLAKSFDRFADPVLKASAGQLTTRNLPDFYYRLGQQLSADHDRTMPAGDEHDFKLWLMGMEVQGHYYAQPISDQSNETVPGNIEIDSLDNVIIDNE